MQTVFRSSPIAYFNDLPERYFATWPTGEKREKLPDKFRDSLAAWEEVANRVLRGEFHGCSDGMRKSLLIGLGRMESKAARAAVEKLTMP